MSSQFFPYARPRKVTGGIKARGARGSLGQTWWSRRFVDVLESYALGSRMTRGRSYARAGQVISLAVAPGEVTASVQGSSAKPYQVTIGLAPYAPSVWASIELALVEQAVYSARLLAGDVPHDLEELFAAQRVSLFPTAVRDLTMRCSCPDSAVPCKHIAATFYLLAEAFDEDPFEILHWRGRPKRELLDRLSALRTGEPDQALAGRSAVDPGEAVFADAECAPDSGAAPSAGGAEGFWLPSQPLPPRPATPDSVPDLLVRQMANPHRALGGDRLAEALRVMYQRFRPAPPSESGPFS